MTSGPKVSFCPQPEQAPTSTIRYAKRNQAPHKGTPDQNLEVSESIRTLMLEPYGGALRQSQPGQSASTERQQEVVLRRSECHKEHPEGLHH